MSNLPTKCPICGIKATLKCSGCKNVVYCGKEHQKIHWRKVHKLSCKCYEISNDPILGRYLRATKDIKKGEIILRELPLIYGPKISTYPICLGCHKTLIPQLNAKTKQLNFYHCTKCNWPLCNKNCELLSTHQSECQLMFNKHFQSNIKLNNNNLKKESAYCVILPLRILLMKSEQPQLYEKILQLEDHLDNRINTPLYSILKSNLVTFIRVILGLNEFQESDILKIAAILDTNSYEIRRQLPPPVRTVQTETKTETETGTETLNNNQNCNKLRALYWNASMISHNCTPNTRHLFQNDNFEIIYIATIDIKKGQPITTSYTQPLNCTLIRRQHLRVSKCFECICERCQDPTEMLTYTGAIICSKCQIGKIISMNPKDDTAIWKCHLCTHQIPAKSIIWGNTAIQKEIELLDKMSPKTLEEFLIKYQDTLHDRNTHVLQIKYALVQLYGKIPGFGIQELNNAAIDRKLALVTELLEIAEIFDPGWSIFRGNLLLEYQEILVVQTMRQYQNQLLTKQAAQERLMESMESLKEACEIFKYNPEMQSALTDRLTTLAEMIENE